MPDSPDYSKYLPSSNRFSLQDMGELVVRLGSPYIFDRRGEVVFMDTFRYGVGGYSVGTSGANGSNKLSVDARDISPFVWQIITPSTAGKLLTITRYVGSDAIGRNGILIVERNQQAYANHTISISASINGTHLRGRVTLDIANNQILVDTPTGSIVVADYSDVFATTIAAFTPIKLVVDFDTGKYVRLLINNFTVNLSTYDLVDLGALEANQIFFLLAYTGGSGAQSITQISTIIVTGNEP